MGERGGGRGTGGEGQRGSYRERGGRRGIPHQLCAWPTWFLPDALPSRKRVMAVHGACVVMLPMDIFAARHIRGVSLGDAVRPVAVVPHYPLVLFRRHPESQKRCDSLSGMRPFGGWGDWMGDEAEGRESPWCIILPAIVFVVVGYRPEHGVRDADALVGSHAPFTLPLL